MNGRAVVVDLDGTLLTVNTFHRYIAFMSRVAFGSSYFDVLAKIALAVAARGMRLIPHAEMKRMVLGATVRHASDGLMDGFTAQLRRYADSRVLTLIEKCRGESDCLVLATAAPDVYARRIAGMYGFDACIATPSDTSGQWRELSGVAKRDAVCRWLEENSLKLATVITDHADDLPLMACNATGANILVSPGEATVRRVEAAGVGFEILR